VSQCPIWRACMFLLANAYREAMACGQAIAIVV